MLLGLYITKCFVTYYSSRVDLTLLVITTIILLHNYIGPFREPTAAELKQAQLHRPDRLVVSLSYIWDKVGVYEYNRPIFAVIPEI